MSYEGITTGNNTVKPRMMKDFLPRPRLPDALPALWRGSLFTGVRELAGRAQCSSGGWCAPSHNLRPLHPNELESQHRPNARVKSFSWVEALGAGWS